MTNLDKDYFNAVSSFGIMIGVFASIVMEIFSDFLLKPSRGTPLFCAYFAMAVVAFVFVLIIGKMLCRKLFEKLIKKFNKKSK